MSKKNFKFPPSLPPTLKFWRTKKLRRTSIFYSLLAVIIFSNYLFFLSPVNASTRADLTNQLNITGNQAGWTPAGPTLAQIIQSAISAFLGLLGIIFIVLIIYSGFNWMTAAGDEEKVTLAKNTLIRAVIGLIIIISAYSITYFVFSSLPGGGAGGGSGADTTIR